MKKKQKGLFGLILLLLILSGALVIVLHRTPGEDKQMAAEEDPTSMEEKLQNFWNSTQEDPLVFARRSGVMVETSKVQGSGVIYGQTEEALVLVTAAHVVTQMGEDAPSMQVVFEDPDSTRSGVMDVKVYEDLDLAFLTVSKEDLTDGFFTSVHPAAHDAEISNDLKPEAYLYLYDAAKSNELGFCLALLQDACIYVEDFGQYFMVMTGNAQAGMSGCGVYQEDGILVGILSASGEDNLLVAVPAPVVESCYSLYMAGQN